MTPIEAVYTFPLTSRAVLLGLEVIIGGILHGAAVEKTSAEEQPFCRGKLHPR